MDLIARELLSTLWGKDLEEAYDLIRARYLDYQARKKESKCYARVYTMPKKAGVDTFGVGACFCDTPQEVSRLIPKNATTLLSKTLDRYPDEHGSRELLITVWKMVNPDKKPQQYYTMEGQTWLG